MGEAPSRAGDRYYRFPLSGAVGKRLCEFAGIEPEDEGSQYGRWYWALREHFDCLNVIERFADAYPWRVEVARERWRVWRADEGRGTTVVVCLGNRAADAVGLGSDAPWGGWESGGGLTYVKIPHPSGRNRLYNDEATRARAGVVLREAMVICQVT